MNWLIITRLGPTRVFIVRNNLRAQAIQHVANEADFEYNDDMDGDYVEVHQIPGGECVEITADID